MCWDRLPSPPVNRAAVALDPGPAVEGDVGSGRHGVAGGGTAVGMGRARRAGPTLDPSVGWLLCGEAKHPV